MKKCSYCAEEIQEEAVVCRYCGRDLPQDAPPVVTKVEHEQPKNTNRIVWYFIAFISIIFIALVIGFGSGGGSSSKAKKTINGLTTSERWDYKVAAEEVVKVGLKAPSTAVFPDIDEWYLSKSVGGIVTASAYVDSQNSFGAMIRNDFTIQLTSTMGLIYAEIGGEVYYGVKQ